MKLTDLKHDHSLTNLLKVLIFSILMLTPFFYVATKCLYVVCNKNAYESYYGETINEYEETTLTSLNELKNGNTYYFLSSNSNTLNNYDGKRIYISNVKIITPSATDSFNETIVQATSFTTTYYDNIAYLIPYIDNIRQTGLPMNVRNIYFSFTFENQVYPSGYTYSELWDNFITKREYNNYSYLDNVFEYSLNQMSQSQLFTWTQNTGVYTGANAMTTGLGLTSPVIPILISYWFLLTIIYVVIDIVIVCFTTITHMIVKKSN